MFSAIKRSISYLLCLAFLSGCGSSSSDDEPTPGGSSSSQSSEASGDGQIRVNQLGFLPGAQKYAVVSETDAEGFELVDASSGAVVFSGTLTEAAEWSPAGEAVRVADFSAWTQPGDYHLQVAGAADSPDFEIAEDVYAALNDAALKAYYFNRASVALEEEHAGDYARPAGHPDTNVLIHASAEDGSRSAGDAIEAPKGWYDAGDFGKYVVNSGISTYTLLAAYEHFPEFYRSRDVNIPESGDAQADILDEALWNLAWMLEMQDEDGGVYHKLTTLNFVGEVMPHESDTQRYVIGKGTSATLNFAAVMAVGSRVFAEIDSELSTRMLTASQDAWQWAQANDDLAFSNPADVATGEYGDSGPFEDEFAWAAAELYITTGDPQYYDAFVDQGIDNWVPGWHDTRGLAWMSLAFHKDHLGEEANVETIEARVTGLANTLSGYHEASAYRVAMNNTNDFYWGSNGSVLNRAMMLLQGYRLDPTQDRYLEAAQSLFDYILGRNPTGYSYVTGYGDKTPMHIHHRVSEADGIDAPVPGFVVGGPNTDEPADCEQNGLNYPAGREAIAKAYLDEWCSYSTNEVTINWNAPLVYVSGALQSLANDGE